MTKIDQVKEYIKKGIVHYREQKEVVGVTALQSVLSFIDTIYPVTAAKQGDSSPSRSFTFEAIIPTTFSEFSRSFYEGLLLGPVTVYQEVQRKLKRGVRVSLEPVGFAQVGITGNIICVRGQMVEVEGCNAIALVEDSVGGPALKITQQPQSNMKIVVKGD